jgi:hypothetical protein
LRAKALRFFPPRSRPFTPKPRTYPTGWSVDELGPHFRPASTETAS